MSRTMNSHELAMCCSVLQRVAVWRLRIIHSNIRSPELHGTQDAKGAAEANRLRQIKISKTAVTAVLRSAARVRVVESERQVATQVKFLKKAMQSRKALFSTVKNLDNDSARTMQVLQAITTIATAQVKERLRLSRNVRHEEGAFTPIVLTTAHQSPGRHVYDRHETMTHAQRVQITLEGRNARSRNLTPVLAKVSENTSFHQQEKEQDDPVPYYPGARRSRVQRLERLKEDESAVSSTALKHTLAKANSQAGTPVVFALQTPTFKLPSGNNTPAKYVVCVCVCVCVRVC